MASKGTTRVPSDVDAFAPVEVGAVQITNLAEGVEVTPAAIREENDKDQTFQAHLNSVFSNTKVNTVRAVWIGGRRLDPAGLEAGR